jgi:hypothetical protein
VSGASLLVASAIGVGGGGFIYGVTARRDRALSPDTRSEIAAFLTAGGRTPTGTATLARTLHLMFQSLFGERQWSVAAVGRLAVVSALVLAATIVVPGAKYPDLLMRLAGLPDVNDVPSVAALPLLGKTIVFVLVISTFGIVGSAIPTFLALWKSRFWLRLIERNPSRLQIVCAALCDALGSLLIDIGFATLVSLADDWLEDTPAPVVLRLSDNVWSIVAGSGEFLGIPSNEPTDIVSLAFFVVTLTGCLWLALSAVAIALVRLWARYANRGDNRSALLDLAARPIRGLGLVAAILVAVTPVAYCLI